MAHLHASTDHSTQTKPRDMRPRWAALALVLIVLVGGFMRFTGQNWDDFSAMHPDERFLTQNLLPRVGGVLDPTRDDTNFPIQGVYSLLDNQTYISTEALRQDATARAGALRAAVSADFARWWLGDTRVLLYDDPNAAVRALVLGEVQALIFDEPTYNTLSLSNPEANLRGMGTISSEDVQLIRCQALYPQTGGVGGYFDARCSNLNPHNSAAGFYAYGTLPLFLARWASDVLLSLQNSAFAPFGVPLVNFQGETLVWRFLSAFFDVGSIIVIYLIGARLHNRWTGLVAALLYACAPLAIQKAHYGTVNSITAFFVVLALYAAVQVQDKGRWWAYGLFGVAFGASLAGRINIAPLVGVVVLAALIHSAPIWDRRIAWSERQRLLTYTLMGLVLAGFCTVLTFRLTNPYAFTGPGFFGLQPNNRFLADLASGAYGVSGNSDAPPNWQWLGRASYFYPLKDMLLWGMGLPFGIMAWVGVAWGLWQALRAAPYATRNLTLLAWAVVYFFWMGNQWVMTMRYYLPLYGAFALLAAWALVELWKWGRTEGANLSLTRGILALLGVLFASVPAYTLLNGQVFTPTVAAASALAGLWLGAAFVPRLGGWRGRILAVSSVAFTALWGLMFLNIYTDQLTRVQASRYVWEQIAGDFAMRLEGAPEGTPLINIAITNARPESSPNQNALLSSATRYETGTIYTSEFTAPADGIVREILAPHLGDLQDDPDDESLYISLAALNLDGSLELLSESTITQDFSRARHILGDSYRIPLPQAVSLQAGRRYSLKVEALAGPFVGGGNVLLTEGDWDDRLPTVMVCHLPDGLTLADNPRSGLSSYQSCNGLQSWYGLIHSYDLAMSYPVDEAIKLESILDGLEVGDYLTITSNRFYDTLTRNRLRWPLSSAYYDLLFSGELGFELVAVFTEEYTLGTLISVSSQHLPIFDSPAWLNELEADEAFHVYDHPAVFIFRKSPDYDHRAVTAKLLNVPIQRIEQVLSAVAEFGSELMGVVYWTSLQADSAPNGLLLAPDTRQLNREGGTWSERFERDSLLNRDQTLGAGAWYVLMVIYGLAAFPLLFVLFPNLGDRGYGVAKFVGLLLVSYVAWLAASLKLPLWSQAGIAGVLLALIAFSAYWAWRARTELARFVRQHWRRLLIIEVLTLVLFIAFIGVRLTNPDLWHDFKGGEKPMDFAMFNSVLRATSFPPSDAWFSDGYINYYYYGYVLVGSPVLLLKLVPAFAYNLIIPSLFAITGIGAFSAAFNIVERWRERRRFDSYGQETHPRLGNPYIAGVAALLLCVVLGNLDTVRVLGIGVAQLGGYRIPTGIEAWLLAQSQEGTSEPPSPELSAQVAERARAGYLTDRIAYEVSNSLNLVTSLARGTSLALQGAALPIGTDRWYWGPSRVLAETPGVEGNAITEMPYFTFVYGDLHAHMINLPILLFVILWIFNELVQARDERRAPFVQVLALALGALAVGMIEATNTWDWPAFLLFSILGLGYAWWLKWQSIHRWSVLEMLARIGGFITFSFAVSLPYTTWYAATYGSVQAWTGGKTPLWAYFDIHGVFLFLLVSLFVWETARWLRATKVKVLRGQRLVLVLALASMALVLALSVAGALASYQVMLIAFPLLAWIAVLFFRPQQSVELQFVLVTAGLALAMTLGVEFVVLGGDIGRQNTVFKFYMQAWILLSVAGGAAFAWLFQASDQWRMRWSFAWYAPLTVLLIIAAMFPIMATRGRSFDRMSPNIPLTLDGLEYMRHASHVLTYTATQVNLSDDYAIIRYLQDNAQGMPVVLEGRNVASEYTLTGRIAINTGLPTVLGWRFHQTQQRTFDPLPRWVDVRENNVKFFYNSSDIFKSVRMLWHYDVSYVVVSGLERAFSTPEGLAKIEQMRSMGILRLVHMQGEGQLYEVNREAMERYLIDNTPVSAQGQGG